MWLAIENVDFRRLSGRHSRRFFLSKAATSVLIIINTPQMSYIFVLKMGAPRREERMFALSSVRQCSSNLFLCIIAPLITNSEVTSSFADRW